MYEYDITFFALDYSDMSYSETGRVTVEDRSVDKAIAAAQARLGLSGDQCSKVKIGGRDYWGYEFMHRMRGGNYLPV